MSTRGVIARPTPQGGWAGCYLHWDNYPAGRGKALWEVYHNEAHGDIEDMLRFYIDEHPGGWSTMKPLEREPADVMYDATRFWSKGRYSGACYCHRADNGERGPEPDMPVTSDGDHCGTEYAYVLDPATHTMIIHEFVYAGAPTYEARGWRLLATVDLDGPEPEWGRMQ